jgi:hypothetical protein
MALLFSISFAVPSLVETVVTYPPSLMVELFDYGTSWANGMSMEAI